MNTQFYLPGMEPAPRTLSPLSLSGALAGLPLPPLFNYPDVHGADRSLHAKCIGRAGECQLDSVLIRLGFESLAVGENLGYDRIIGLNLPHAGALTLLARVQAKAATKATNGYYRFSMSCGYRGSPQGRRAYADDAFDIAALVILPHNAVYFTAEKRGVHEIPVSAVPQLIARPQDSLLRALNQVLSARAAATAAATEPDSTPAAG